MTKELNFNNFNETEDGEIVDEDNDDLEVEKVQLISKRKVKEGSTMRSNLKITLNNEKFDEKLEKLLNV